MLTPEQHRALDQREPDVTLCPHVIEVREMGTLDGPQIYILVLKGHMVMDAGEVTEDAAVEDHRMFAMEIPLTPEGWGMLTNSLNETNDMINRIARGYHRHESDGVPPDSIARFMNSIPQIFLNPRKKDDQ